MDNVILIGMPGSGKSSVGVILAKMLGMGFCDTDVLLQQRTGRKLQEIIDTEGVEQFLNYEQQTILSLDCRHDVIATGGSVVLRERAMTHLKVLGKLVYLSASFEVLQGRINNTQTRGIAGIKGNTLQDIYKQRVPLYEKYADLIVCNEEACSAMLLERIADQITKLGVSQ